MANNNKGGGGGILASLFSAATLLFFIAGGAVLYARYGGNVEAANAEQAGNSIGSFFVWLGNLILDFLVAFWNALPI